MIIVLSVQAVGMRAIRPLIVPISDILVLLKKVNVIFIPLLGILRIFGFEPALEVILAV